MSQMQRTQRISVMKPALFLKSLAYMLMALFLVSCAQATKTNTPQTTPYPDTNKPVPGPDSAKGETLLRDSSINLDQASQLLAYHEKRLERGGDSRVLDLVELTRICFLLGELGDKQGSEKYFEKGRYYAELLSTEQPGRVEGHYWLALNLAGLAQCGRASRGLRLVPVIVEKLQAAVTLDEAYDQAGPHRILGRVYCEAPPWPLSEGDLDKSLQHLRTAVELAPQNSTNHLYLAGTLTQLGQSSEAYTELQQVLVCTNHAISRRNLEEDHQEAVALMKQHENPAQPATNADSEEQRLAVGPARSK
jgi:tetratricopeptide (TPR) repeat protein